MASQLAIELTLENAAACIFASAGSSGAGTAPTYAMGNVNLIPEILEFDASYDSMFLAGLRDGGVPIKFSSWHTFIFSTNGAANVNLLIQERSRSVKALFAVQRKSPADITLDSHALLFDTSTYNSSIGNSLQNYQFRIGGRYYPAAPVQTSTSVGSSITNGGAEAYIELQKALNIVGDYRLSSNVNTLRWAIPPATAAVSRTGATSSSNNDLDYTTTIASYGAYGNPTYKLVSDNTNTVNIPFAGNQGSGVFAMSTSLETSNGIEISGLNAEEQSDIALIANWGSAQNSTAVFEVYSYYDAMIILRENNVVELIQ